MGFPGRHHVLPEFVEKHPSVSGVAGKRKSVLVDFRKEDVGVEGFHIHYAL